MTQLLEEYALLAEIISAIAIVISLVFVGIQIRGNTRATQASTFHEIAALDSPGFHAYWKEVGFAFSADFARWLDGLFSKFPGEPKDA